MAYWNVVHTTLAGNKVVESYKCKETAQARYEELLPRTYGSLGDITNVSEPVESIARANVTSGFDWDDFADVVRKTIVGLEACPRNKSFRVERTHNLSTVRSNDGTALMGIEMPSAEEETVYIRNMSMDTNEFNKAFDVCKSAVDDMVATFLTDYDPTVVKVDNVNEDGESAASLGACPTGAVHKDRPKDEGKVDYSVYSKDLDDLQRRADSLIGDNYDSAYKSAPTYMRLPHIKQGSSFGRYTKLQYDPKVIRDTTSLLDIYVDNKTGDIAYITGAVKDSLGNVVRNISAGNSRVSRNPWGLYEGVDALNIIYGDGVYDTYENSASGFYVTPKNPLGWAVLNNDTATMESLRGGSFFMPDKPWQYTGWIEDLNSKEDAFGNYPYIYDMDTDYNLEFVEDWHRVVRKQDNEPALNLLLDYYPDFVLCPIDFWNAFHKGYDRRLLKRLFDNIRDAVGNDDDLNINYFGFDDFGENPVRSLEEFLNT